MPGFIDRRDAEPHFDDDPRLSVLRHLSAPVWVFDVDRTRILWANAAGLAFWSARSAAELIERDLSDLSPQVARRLHQYREDCARTGESFREHWTLFPNDAPHTVPLVLAPFALADGRVALLVNVDADMPGKQHSGSLLGIQALMQTSSMIGLYDRDWRPHYLNPAARAAEPLHPHPFAERFVDPGGLACIERALAGRGECEIELEVRAGTGIARHAITVRRARSPITGDETRVLTAIDVTQRHAAEHEVQRLAFTDSLTGLANRVQLARDIRRRLPHDPADDSSSGHPDGHATDPQFALLFLDLDRFKLVNDSLGHAAGDALLVQVAERLRLVGSSKATIARLGGDEFVVLDAIGPADGGGTRLAEDILTRMEPAFEVEGHRLRVRPSIGICVYPEDGDSADELMRHADIAMYAAKASRSGFATFDGQMNSDACRRLSIENGLARALERDRFEIHYQPRMCSKSGEQVGFEALLRWRDPERGLVFPADFIGVAEESGLILPIGAHVMRESMRQQRAWAIAGYPLCMSINVSARQFDAEDLLETVVDCLAESDADPAMIELEITESVLLGDVERVVDTLRAISSLGVRVAIDDFGTGYSNLAYLKRYPLDCLKIDRSFIVDPDQVELLELILGISRTLGLTTVAEGVETTAQARWLAEHGCDELQGFLYARPMPSAEAFAWLAAHHARLPRAA